MSLLAVTPAGEASARRYLFIWAGDEDRRDQDFLAVVDVTTASPRYGDVTTTVLAGGGALQPHHTEYVLPAGHPLFANGFGGNRTLRFDVANPQEPRLLGEVEGGRFTFAHSFARLPEGSVLATMQAQDLDYRGPGGLVEFDDDGRVIRSASAAAGGSGGASIRPYSLAVLPAHDRVISTSAVMGLPGWHADPAGTQHEHDGRHVQLWRLSDLKLLRTIELPARPDSRAHLQPAEPRLTETGEAFVVTMECGLFRITGLAADTFGAELVHDFGGTNCAVPVSSGRLWFQSVGSARSVVVLDLSKPSAPVEISRLELDEAQSPHWLAMDPSGGRLLVVNGPTGERRIWMLTIDAAGNLALDTGFRDAGSDRPGLSFDREDWPHGRTGAAIPHGSVFAK